MSSLDDSFAVATPGSFSDFPEGFKDLFQQHEPEHADAAQAVKGDDKTIDVGDVTDGSDITKTEGNGSGITSKEETGGTVSVSKLPAES